MKDFHFFKVIVPFVNQKKGEMGTISEFDMLIDQLRLCLDFVIDLLILLIAFL